MENILTLETKTIRELSIEPMKENPRFYHYVDHKAEYLGTEVINEVYSHGFALESELRKIKGMEFVNKEIPVSWMYEGRAGILGIPKDFYTKVLSGEAHVSGIYNFRIFNDSYYPEEMVYVLTNSGSFEVADLLENPIPIPIKLNYIDGAISDANYDLPGLLEYLKSRPDKFSPVYYDEEKTLEITEIPYYNADDYTGHKHINFLYHPSKEEAASLKGISLSYEKTKWVIEHTEIQKFKKNVGS